MGIRGFVDAVLSRDEVHGAGESDAAKKGEGHLRDAR